MTNFGETSILTTDHALGTGVIYVYGPFSPPSDGTLTDIAMYLHDGNGSQPAVLCCYLDSSTAPGALVAKTASFDCIADGIGWRTKPVVTPVSIFAASAYWFGVFYNGSSSDAVDETESSGGHIAFTAGLTGSYPTPPDPFGTPGGTLSWRGSYYGVYTAAGPPTSDFTGTPLTIRVGQSAAFSDASTGTPISWAWTKQLGGGGYSAFSGTPTAQNPTETFTAPGVYDIRLVATNAGGSDTKTRTGYVTVLPAYHRPPIDRRRRM